jgi:hypothetical protein
VKFHIGNLNIAPTYLQAGLIILFVFILILGLAYMSRSFMSWSLSGFWIGLFLGFILTVILEGILLTSGKSVLTSILGWKDAPAPISNVLDAGRTKLSGVLGTSSVCPTPTPSPSPSPKN